MTNATIVGTVNTEALAQRAADIKAQAERVKERESAQKNARDILNSPDLRGRAQALMGALRRLGVKIEPPPAEGPALASWCESAAYFLKLHSVPAPKKSVGRPNDHRLGQPLLSEKTARSLGWKPQKSKK